MDSNSLLEEPAERRGNMTGTSPVTPLLSATAWLATCPSLGVTGLVPVMPPTQPIHGLVGVKGASPVMLFYQ